MSRIKWTNDMLIEKAKEFAFEINGQLAKNGVVDFHDIEDYKNFYSEHNGFSDASFGSLYDYAFEDPEIPSNLVAGTPPPIGPGALSKLTKLGRYFASLSQMSSKGKVIATSVRDAPRLVAQYGGRVKDWIKMSSATHKGRDGFKFATHWYKNIKTGKIVEYKTKLGG